VVGDQLKTTGGGGANEKIVPEGMLAVNTEAFSDVLDVVDEDSGESGVTLK
jgi:hypothetical protein